ncbi:phosphomevalonate kinase [Vagococcus xieshaowenii]|uniref:phosphomevalonate kinase n=1 Tax=Vagococcus xieshaowenii TaxID=2562451 RepID=A0AAJ5EDY8_9ENTE|nr:phosphomevalonate kinase [Vagococcus xieshaowenii]QCA28664.1 phosphomevalonate kinase [Vagococcus xieshaowenii]TFZ40528.1 phosphomevalonate kinase [Vagococcus xieshaowenii]
MIKASAPGKLYIAGEYAVLEPGHPAILVALNQYITVKLTQTNNLGTIRSSLTNGFPIPWTRKQGKFFMDQRENPFAYVVEAVTTTEKYLSELNKPLHFFNLEIESDLDNHDGRKYGLGSSGAVTVATIKALLKFYHVPFTSETLYKLAAITHLAINSNGSFGDLAASSFGGWIAYSCFDREWLMNKISEHSLSELLEMDWPLLNIEPLQVPNNLELLIGWTGTPASTTHLVDLINDEKAEIRECYTHFLAESKTVVEKMLEGFKEQEIKTIQTGIKQNRQLLQQLGKSSGIQIETSTLFEMCEIAEEYGGAAKSSGAGGGDCGIVIIEKRPTYTPLFTEWLGKNITPLPLLVHYDYVKQV